MLTTLISHMHADAPDLEFTLTAYSSLELQEKG